MPRLLTGLNSQSSLLLGLGVLAKRNRYFVGGVVVQKFSTQTFFVTNNILHENFLIYGFKSFVDCFTERKDLVINI